jgi:hypothetical protein
MGTSTSRLVYENSILMVGATPTTWDPTQVTGCTVLSGDNLIATMTVPPFEEAGTRTVGSFGNTEKKYAEFVIPASGAGNGNWQVGVAPAAHALSNVFINVSDAAGCRGDGQNNYNGGGSSGPMGTRSTGDVYGLAFDGTTSQMEIFINGVSSATVNCTGIAFPLFFGWRTTDNGDSVTARFSSASWQYSAPSGFSQVTM